MVRDVDGHAVAPPTAPNFVVSPLAARTVAHPPPRQIVQDDTVHLTTQQRQSQLNTTLDPDILMAPGNAHMCSGRRMLLSTRTGGHERRALIIPLSRAEEIYLTPGTAALGNGWVSVAVAQCGDDVRRAISEQLGISMQAVRGKEYAIFDGNNVTWSLELDCRRAVVHARMEKAAEIVEAARMGRPGTVASLTPTVIQRLGSYGHGVVLGPRYQGDFLHLDAVVSFVATTNLIKATVDPDVSGLALDAYNSAFDDVRRQRSIGRKDLPIEALAHVEVGKAKEVFSQSRDGRMPIHFENQL